MGKKFCKHPGGWKRNCLLQTAKVEWKGRRGFPRPLYFLLCEICKCVASKHISKQSPDVLKSSKPPTELSRKLSSMPGHPIWCCCLPAMVSWPLHSFRLNITILCEGILYFIVLVFFCLVSRASTRKNPDVPGRDLLRRSGCVPAAALWPGWIHFFPFYSSGSCGSDLLVELCQQLIFVRFSVVFERKRHVCGGVVYSNLKGNILFCCWVFGCILDEWEWLSKLGNYF